MQTSDQRILITGAHGFVGQAITKELLAAGFSVRALVRHPISNGEQHARFTEVEGDLRNISTLKAALLGITSVVHCAARKNDEYDSEAINVGGAKNLIAVCEELGIRHIINLSTQSVRLREQGMYARTKALADRLFSASNIPTTTLRCSVIYDNLSTGILGSMFSFSKLPIIPIIGNGDAVFYPLHRDDLALIIRKILEIPNMHGRTYDVGGLEGYTFNTLIDLIVASQQIQRWKLHLPIPLCLWIARSLRCLRHPPLTVSNVLGAKERIEMDPTQILQETGIRPRSLRALFGNKQQNTDITSECRCLLQYIVSTARPPIPVTDSLCRRYEQACEQLGVHTQTLGSIVLRFPWLIGGLDMATRLRFPSSQFQKKLLIAAAIVETDPSSAAWLLAKDRTKIAVCIDVLCTLPRIIWKCCCSCIFLVTPSFLRHNAGC